MIVELGWMALGFAFGCMFCLAFCHKLLAWVVGHRDCPSNVEAEVKRDG